MKNTVLLILSIFILSACENFDDPIPEGSFLETPILSTKLVDSDKVQLTWNSNQFCAGFCPTIVLATSYEIWTKSLTSSANYKFAEVQAGEMRFLVEGLEPGVRQEFYVVAKRANVSNQSNRVMVVPNDLPVVETIFENTGFDYITHPQISPKGDQIAYTISESASIFTSQGVYLYDVQGKTQEKIPVNGNYPSWSAAGDKLVLVKHDEAQSIIRMYSLASNTVEEIVRDSFKQYFPAFAVADTTLVYFLDSLDEGNQRMIVYNLDEEATNPKNPVRAVLYPENSVTPMLGMSYEAEGNNLAYGLATAKETNTGSAYDIVGFAVNSPSVLINWVMSDWNDSNPAFSPTDPDLLAFISDRSGVAQLWIRNSATGRLIQVTDFQENEWITTGVVGLSWFGEKLYCNTRDSQGGTKMVLVDVSSLL
ncbi:hypothetical protein LZF95_13465 [Algoriphagus sp. AGSA1]|uniref:TolB family protein n=1 Tax=Algoriphagus sp. AGSA1 TaxID=2907213 RepID=UPI001F1E3B4E|nr:hypothetical protein [Algoriphagus sp. AGSA1]MCE7055689.1 hypothetical protein [Algoriphagus sp. AGSA1]